MLLVTACSSDDSLTADGNYLVCSLSRAEEAGVLILNSAGETVLELPNAFVEYCFSKDGFIIQPKVGELSPDDRLMIRMGLSEAEISTGVWSVGDEKWLIEPQAGYYALSKFGTIEQLEALYLGGHVYDKDFNRIDMENTKKPEFKVNKALILTDSYDENGDCCFADQDGKVYLTSKEFEERNPVLRDLFRNGLIHLRDVIYEKYLLIYYDHQTEKEDGKYLINTHSALCDLNGVMQYPELEYTSAGFPYNQYGCLDRNFVKFSGKDEKYIENYLDLTTNELVDFPEGTSNIEYKGNGFFLLENDSNYTIFDALTCQTGSSFTEAGVNTYVLGLQSYVIQSYKNGKVVIDGIEQELDSETEGANILEGEYPIIQISKRFGELRASYVLNPEGKLMVETPKDVIYANERYYISVENDEYHINEMVRFNILSLPNGMFNL